MGRTWQLRQVLPIHLMECRDRTDVELVLLDYNSDDGLEHWIQNHSLMRQSMDKGLLVYVKEHTAAHFHSSKAKNLAHRMAGGDILINLDCDNWMDAIDQQAREAFCRSLNVLLHAPSRTAGDGTHGRIGIARTWFYLLGGYDEDFEPAGYQDRDFLHRASSAGLEMKPYICSRSPIQNNVGAKLSLTGSALAFQQMSEINRAKSESRLAQGNWIANPTGWGSGIVSVNFGRWYNLLPELPASMSPEAPHIP